MKDWLEAQKNQEDDMLDAVKIQAKQVVEDLIPQVRLCALENDMSADVVLKVHFEFSDNETDIWTEGNVQFPPLQSKSQCFKIQGEEEES